jgi:predicted RNase H-like nuclease
MDTDPDAGPLFVGAHWSPEGWVSVAFSPAGFADATVDAEVGQLWGRVEDRAERVLVDVPVGLVEEGDPERPPDRLARAVLGDRAATVTTPPVREATRKRRYPAAERTMQRKTGAALSRAAFAASEAIAAVDELLQEVPESREVVGEAHPELCFRAFAGEPMAHSRRTAGGYAERLRTLAEFDRDAPPTVQSAAEAVAGTDVRVEDVLDAAVLAYTARPGPGELRTLPPEPEADATGLPMRLYYRAAEPL